MESLPFFVSWLYSSLERDKKVFCGIPAGKSITGRVTEESLTRRYLPAWAEKQQEVAQSPGLATTAGCPSARLGTTRGARHCQDPERAVIRKGNLALCRETPTCKKKLGTNTVASLSFSSLILLVPSIGWSQKSQKAKDLMLPTWVSIPEWIRMETDRQGRKMQFRKDLI